MPDEPYPLPHELLPGDWFRRLRKEEIFPDGATVELDLGCGDGSFLVRMAERFPETRFLGVERLLGRVRKVSRKAERLGLTNVRVLRIDSGYAVRHLLPGGFARRIHFLCPDPWPKKKHASRRQMCQAEFLSRLHGMLEEGGELLFKTDSAAYYEGAREAVGESGLFEELPWEEGAFFYPASDFEEQWLAEGRVVKRLRLGRR